MDQKLVRTEKGGVQPSKQPLRTISQKKLAGNTSLI